VLPVSSAHAAPPADSPTSINFNILPGQTATAGQPVKHYFTYVLAPGRSVNDSVMIVNPSKTTSLTVKLRVLAAVTSPHNAALTYSGAARQVGGWIRLAASTVTVPPFSISHVPMFVNLPASVRPGEYQGTVAATDARPAVLPSKSTKGKGVPVHVYLTKQCDILVHVTGHASAGMQIPHVTTAAVSKHAVLNLTLRNTGTLIAYRIVPLMTFTTVSGSVRTLQAPVGAIQGGATTTVMLPVDGKVPPGPYKVTIKVAYLADTRFPGPAQLLQTVWTGNLNVPAAPSS
jgi:hypothetical protein